MFGTGLSLLLMKKKFKNNNTSTQETEPLTPQEQAQKQLDELAKKV